MLLRMIGGLAAASAFFLAAPATAKLSPAEQKMVQVVDSEQERTVAMLGRWVERNSGTMNFEGVRAVGEMLPGKGEHRVAELRLLGGQLEVHEARW